MLNTKSDLTVIKKNKTSEKNVNLTECKGNGKRKKTDNNQINWQADAVDAFVGSLRSDGLKTHPTANKRKYFAAKDIIYHQGAIANTVYIIHSGLVLLLRSLPNGRERIVRLLGETEWIGLEGLVNKPHQHTAIAVNDVEICRISMKTLHPIFHQSRCSACK